MKRLLTGKNLWAVSFVLVILVAVSMEDGCKAELVFSLEPDITTEEVTQRYGDILYTLKAVTTCNITSISMERICSTKYYHLVGHNEDDQVLMSVDSTAPSAHDILVVLGAYLLAIEEGI